MKTETLLDKPRKKMSLKDYIKKERRSALRNTMKKYLTISPKESIKATIEGAKGVEANVMKGMYGPTTVVALSRKEGSAIGLHQQVVNAAFSNQVPIRFTIPDDNIWYEVQPIDIVNHEKSRHVNDTVWFPIYISLNWSKKIV